jgi:hypothetical protein
MNSYLKNKLLFIFFGIHFSMFANVSLFELNVPTEEEFQIAQAESNETDEFSKLFDVNNYYRNCNCFILSNMVFGVMNLFNGKNNTQLIYGGDYKKIYCLEFLYARRIHSLLDAYVGVDYDKIDHIKTTKGIFGLRFDLPFNSKLNTRIDSTGHIKFRVKSSLNVGDYLIFEALFDTDKEYIFIASYIIDKNFLISVVYDSDFKWGAGVRAVF